MYLLYHGHHCCFWDMRRLVLILGVFWSFSRQSQMFSSIHECTRAHPESTVQHKMQNHKIVIYHRARRSKFEILHLKLFFQSCFPPFTHNSSISMNRLINKSIYLVLIVFNLLNQSAPPKRNITIDVDDANNGDSNEPSSAASSL